MIITDITEKLIQKTIDEGGRAFAYGDSIKVEIVSASNNTIVFDSDSHPFEVSDKIRFLYEPLFKSPYEEMVDTDGDGIIDKYDLDADGDGVWDDRIPQPPRMISVIVSYKPVTPFNVGVDISPLVPSVVNAREWGKALIIAGYYPCYITEEEALLASPLAEPTCHTHNIMGRVYYMPEGVDIWHGDYYNSPPINPTSVDVSIVEEHHECGPNKPSNVVAVDIHIKKPTNVRAISDSISEPINVEALSGSIQEPIGVEVNTSPLVPINISAEYIIEEAVYPIITSLDFGELEQDATFGIYNNGDYYVQKSGSEINFYKRSGQAYNAVDRGSSPLDLGDKHLSMPVMLESGSRVTFNQFGDNANNADFGFYDFDYDAEGDGLSLKISAVAEGLYPAGEINDFSKTSISQNGQVVVFSTKPNGAKVVRLNTNGTFDSSSVHTLGGGLEIHNAMQYNTHPHYTRNVSDDGGVIAFAVHNSSQSNTQSGVIIYRYNGSGYVAEDISSILDDIYPFLGGWTNGWEYQVGGGGGIRGIAVSGDGNTIAIGTNHQNNYILPDGNRKNLTSTSFIRYNQETQSWYSMGEPTMHWQNNKPYNYVWAGNLSPDGNKFLANGYGEQDGMVVDLGVPNDPSWQGSGSQWAHLLDGEPNPMPWNSVFEWDGSEWNSWEIDFKNVLGFPTNNHGCYVPSPDCTKLLVSKRYIVSTYSATVNEYVVGPPETHKLDKLWVVDLESLRPSLPIAPEAVGVSIIPTKPIIPESVEVGISPKEPQGVEASEVLFAPSAPINVSAEDITPDEGAFYLTNQIGDPLSYNGTYGTSVGTASDPQWTNGNGMYARMFAVKSIDLNYGNGTILPGKTHIVWGIFNQQHSAMPSFTGNTTQSVQQFFTNMGLVTSSFIGGLFSPSVTNSSVSRTQSADPLNLGISYPTHLATLVDPPPIQITQAQALELINPSGSGTTFFPDTSSPLTDLIMEHGFNSSATSGYFHSIFRNASGTIELRIANDGALQVYNVATNEIGSIGTYTFTLNSAMHQWNLTGVSVWSDVDRINGAVSGGIVTFVVLR
jgi:hypothetical protein